MGVFKDCGCSAKDRCSHHWQLRTRYRGKLYRISAREFANREVTSKGAAKALFADFRTQVRRGVLREGPDPTTWGDFCDLFYDRHVVMKGLKFDHDKPRFEVLKKRWAMKPLAEVTKPRYFDDFLAEKKKLRPGSRNRYRSLFRVMLNFAERRGLILENPFKKGLFPFEREKNQRAIRLTRDQEVALWNAMNPWLKGLFIAALDTGLRAGALLQLRWEDVDLDDRVLTAKASIQKDGEPVKIPISSRLMAVLEFRKSDDPKAFVFGTANGEQRRDFRYAWKKACRIAGIDGLRWHDLRGEMASRLLEAGVSLRDIQLVLGHSTIATTERYLRPRVTAFRDAFAKLEKGQPELRLLKDGNQAERDDSSGESSRGSGPKRH